MRNSPAIKILIPFIAGLLFSRNFGEFIPNVFLSILFISLGVSLIFSFLKKTSHIITYTVLLATSFFVGYASFQIHMASYSKVLHDNVYTYFQGNVLSDTKEGARSNKTTVLLNQIKVKDSVLSVHEKVLVYFPKSLKSSSLHAGDVIVGKSYVNKLQTDKLHAGYVSFLYDNNVYNTMYLKDVQWERMDSAQSGYVNRLQNNRIHHIAKNGFDSVSIQLFATIFMGNKNVVTDDVKQSFSNSGSMHILAVSGLHVGIVAFSIGLLLNVLFGKMKFMEMKAVVLITAIWLYAFLTGMPASVFRASIMFSIFVLSKYVKGEYAPYNSLAVAALIMLLISPMELFKPGFQLSFVAVAGISYLYPLLNKLLISRYAIWNYMWGLTAVSISAQIATLPIIMYYFKQVPIYGILANVPAILIATCLIVLSIAVVVLPFAFVTTFVSYVYNFLSNVLVQILDFIADMPHAVFNVSLTSIQVFMLYGFGIGLVVLREYFLFRKRKYAYS